MFTDQWIPGHFGRFVLGSACKARPNLLQRYSIGDPFKSIVLLSALDLFDRLLARVWGRGMAQTVEIQDVHGSMDSRPFRSFRTRFACTADPN